MNSTALRNRLVGAIGNFLEHYDNALFGLLAPFIAPLFFVDTDPFTALILTYGMLPLGFFTRPLGSLFFGRIGDRFGRRQALFYSLLGMALVSMGMGSIPVYEEIGICAPLLLAIGRMLQAFFAAGESVGGAIFVLEHTPVLKRGLFSSFYDISSIGGILVASGLVTWMSGQGLVAENWRILFWMGGITALPGLILRLMAEDTTEFTLQPTAKSVGWVQTLIEHRRTLLSIILASGFSYTTYYLGFTLMNGYIPLITTISKTRVMEVNTLLLVVDMLLLPCFGYLSYKFGKERMMFLGAVCSVLGAVPLFLLLENASIIHVIIIRLAIIIPGIAFAAPYYAWSMEKVPPPHRYLIVSFGTTLGSQLIGASSSPICLWLYRTMEWSGAPGLYLMMIGIAACWATYPFPKSLFAKSELLNPR